MNRQDLDSALDPSESERMQPVPRPSRPRDAEPLANMKPVVRALPITRDDPAIVRGLRAGEPWARAALFDRCAPVVERIVRRILGRGADEIADVVHDAFVQALASIDKLRDPQVLVTWMQTIATYTACKAIRARRLRKWLFFWDPAKLPEPLVDGVDPHLSEACTRTYAVLERLPTDERVAFALRYIEGLEVERVAELCNVSLSTIKRRLARAETRFTAAARHDEVLSTWLEEGDRWTK
jgi:RNA polymerase sigma-70 factor, ECF subfamily